MQKWHGYIYDFDGASTTKTLNNQIARSSSISCNSECTRSDVVVAEEEKVCTRSKDISSDMTPFAGPVLLRAGG